MTPRLTTNRPTMGRGSDRPHPSQPIRVAQIVTTLARGGAQATVVASAGRQPGPVAVTVLAGTEATEEGTYWGQAELDDVAVVPVPPLVRRPAPIQDLAALRWLIRWLREHRPDVVHTHSAKAGVIGRLAARFVGIPCVHTVHGWGSLRSTRRSVRLVTWLVEWLLARACAALVVVGVADLDFGLARHIGRPDNYRLIRSGVEIGPFDAVADTRRQVRAELGLADRFIIGMVARMSSQKDHWTLLRAFADAEIPSATLVLVGDGPLRCRLTQYTRELGIEQQVLMLGVRADAARLVAGFDTSVLSTKFEGMPRTVVEAAAARVPVVATDVGSIGELIEHEVSGLLVGPNDHNALADALIRSHRNRAEAMAMAEVAAARSTAYSADRMRRELATLWTDLAGGCDPVAGNRLGPVSAARPRPEPDPESRSRGGAVQR